MKRLKSQFTLLAAVALFAMAFACNSTPQKQLVSTLANLGMTANAAYESYLQSAFQGTIPTNDVPKVTAYYRDFQASFSVAVAAAHFATNATIASPDLLDVFSKLETAITTITSKKGGK